MNINEWKSVNIKNSRTVETHAEKNLSAEDAAESEEYFYGKKLSADGPEGTPAL
ncbi:MAG TPA: hypothetical protein IAB63_05930 [Candidatus Onthocola gallistercoris]|uniref:Uncharacterized protein n=1 Tax=Candidatus Onthocola gallistercoris TaxID=2840876 RepID=A0A9D1HHL4_9FIRM|nr:hypothetical protein [Candidatus Onthocola gallistercoris]